MRISAQVNDRNPLVNFLSYRFRKFQHSFAEIVAFVYRSETLHPGEIIASGTVSTGCGLELMRFFNPDDVIELEIEKIGVLRNPIVRESGLQSG